MRPILSWVGVVVFALGVALSAGCSKKTHPVKLFVDPSFEKGANKIAVFPFSSALSPVADPNGLAPKTFDQLFRQALEARTDYNWVAPSSVDYTLQSENLQEEAKRFVDEWRQSHKANAEFLAKIGQALQVDGVLIGVVELWQQDQVDVRESAAPGTYVGATVTIFDPKDGKVLFEASDEDQLEGTRSEDRDAQVVRSGSGQIYSDPGAKSYRAPAYDEVALKVAQALAASIPAR